MIKIEGIFYNIITPIIDEKIRNLCKRPYPLHENGCPNWNKKKGCPPNSKIINKIIDIKKPVYIIYNKYDFKEHCNKMKNKHPKWSKRQIECCLYWQGTARKQLKKKIKIFLNIFRDYYIISCPEGSGTNLTETMKQIKIEIEWPPVNYTYQIVLAGIKIL